MKKVWWLFLFCMAAGIVGIWFFSQGPPPLTDTPESIPNRTQVVPPGTSTTFAYRTSDEARIPDLLVPTPLVRTSTSRLLGISCAHGTDMCKLQAVYDYVRLNYEHSVGSPEHNYIQSAAETLIYGSGDELELAILMASMHRAAGYDTDILRGSYHTFARAYLGNETFVLDPSCQGCRFQDVRVQLTGNEHVFS